MSESLISNLLSPPILFFLLGAVAALAKSDLHLPREVVTALALYLMVAIGFRGGVELAHAGLTPEVGAAALAGVLVGVVIPPIAFGLARCARIDPINAGAIAAHYGSISIVTFVAANSFLSQIGVPHASYMVAIVTLMEAPGIVVGILLARLGGARMASAPRLGFASLRALVRETLLGGSVVLLVGSFAIGAITGDRGMQALGPLTLDLFPGALSIFLLEMGLTTARRLRDFFGMGRFLVGFGVSMPLLGAAVGVLAASVVGLGAGDATLLATLAASASYIAAPAAVRLALPSANPALPLALALGITFPFNVVLGIPLYYTIARVVVGP